MASQDSALQLPAPATKPGETPTKRTITDTTFTQPVRVGDLKVGAFAMLRDRPCKVRARRSTQARNGIPTEHLRRQVPRLPKPNSANCTDHECHTL